MTPQDFSTVLPEVVLAVYAMAALMFGVYTTKDKVAPLISWATAGLFLALALYGSARAVRANAPPLAACSSTTPSRALPR
jgi:NADH:ubiquinone oxidoreductase subunit 2 (subunit N)